MSKLIKNQSVKKFSNRGGARTNSGRPNLYTCKTITFSKSIPVEMLDSLTAYVDQERKKYLLPQN